MSSRGICQKPAGLDPPAGFLFAKLYSFQLPRANSCVKTHLSVTLFLTVLGFTAFIVFCWKANAASQSEDRDGQAKSHTSCNAPDSWVNFYSLKWRICERIKQKRIFKSQEFCGQYSLLQI